MIGITGGSPSESGPKPGISTSFAGQVGTDGKRRPAKESRYPFKSAELWQADLKVIISLPRRCCVLGSRSQSLADLDPQDSGRAAALYRSWLWKIYSDGLGTRSLCKRWASPEDGFDRFYEDMSPTWFQGAVLARRYRNPVTGVIIQVDGTLPYSPATCEWVTARENADDLRKTTVCRWLVEGEIVTTEDVARRCGIGVPQAYSRLSRGKRTWEQLTRVSSSGGYGRPRARVYNVEGDEVTVKDVRRRAAERGVELTTKAVQCRLQHGDRTWDRLLRPQSRRAPRLDSPRKRYEVDGKMYTLQDVQARLPKDQAEAAAWRLPKGWSTWEDLQRPVTRGDGYRD